MAKRDLVKLLVRLYGEPKVKARFEKDARKTMKGAKLSAKEQELLASGDEKAIREYLGQDAAKAAIIKSFLATIIQTAVPPKKKK